VSAPLAHAVVCSCVAPHVNVYLRVNVRNTHVAYARPSGEPGAVGGLPSILLCTAVFLPEVMKIHHLSNVWLGFGSAEGTEISRTAQPRRAPPSALLPRREEPLKSRHGRLRTASEHHHQIVAGCRRLPSKPSGCRAASSSRRRRCISASTSVMRSTNCVTLASCRAAPTLATDHVSTGAVPLVALLIAVIASTSEVMRAADAAVRVGR
jgi:hypothetical protein